METYYLNFTTSKAALDVAARENAGSQMNIGDLQQVIQKIALHEKVDESREFANSIRRKSWRHHLGLPSVSFLRPDYNDYTDGT